LVKENSIKSKINIFEKLGMLFVLLYNFNKGDSIKAIFGHKLWEMVKFE